MTENPLGADNLGDSVDRARLAGITRRQTLLGEVEAQTEWHQENLWANAHVRRTVGEIGFPNMFAQQLETLRTHPSFSDNNIELRTLNWVPNDSKETREADFPRLRAVFGNAVLLTSHQNGVNGIYPQDIERADSIFYALGAAVETDGQLQFHHIAVPDMGKHPSLYTALTEKRYAEAVVENNNDPKKSLIRDSGVSLIIMRSVGIDVSDEAIKKDREESERAAQTFDALFEQKLRTIGEHPRLSHSKEATDEITRLLLDVPKEELTWGDKVSAWSKFRRVQTQPTYAPKMVPLYPWDTEVNRLLVAESFDHFLRTSPIITNASS